MSNLQTYHHLKLDFQNVDNTGKWLIHGTEHHRDNQLNCQEHPIEYPIREFKHDIKESEGNTVGLIFKENVQGQKIQGGAWLWNPICPNVLFKFNEMVVKCQY